MVVVEIPCEIESAWFLEWIHRPGIDAGIDDSYDSWLHENKIGFKPQIKWDEYQGDVYLSLVFESDVDAIEFKLTWL